MGTYAQPGKSTWRKSKICPTNCVAMAEIVNFPSKFVSSNPYFVIKETHWIMWYDSRSFLSITTSNTVLAADTYL